MIEYSILNWLFVHLSLAEFSIQVVISELSEWIKGKTALSQPYKLGSLSKFAFWNLLFGSYWQVLSPLSLILVALFSIHSFLSRLLACPYCICMHLCWLTNWLYLDMDLFTSILLAPIGLVFVAILNKIHI